MTWHGAVNRQCGSLRRSASATISIHDERRSEGVDRIDTMGSDMPSAAGGIVKGAVDPRVIVSPVVVDDSEECWEGEGHIGKKKQVTYLS
jgi:hypothetical protein